jgi:hypothetical protein
LEQVADGRRCFRVGEGQSAVELEVLLAAEPFLVSAFSPIGKIHLRDGVREGGAARLSEGFDDIAVADTVIEHDVDAFARGLREAGNLAITGASVTEAERVCHSGWISGLMDKWIVGVMEW